VSLPGHTGVILRWVTLRSITKAIYQFDMKVNFSHGKESGQSYGDSCLGQRSGREPGANFDRNPVELLPAATRDEMKQRTDYWKGLLQ